MIPLTLADVARLTGGSVHGDPALRVTGAAHLDSRVLEPGGLFVAVRGEHADGHDHAVGAHAVLGSRPTGAPTVVVDDPVVALGRLARHVVRTVAPRVLAVSGSHGKTTTKDLLGALLPVAVVTRGNLNNELGVALTALRLEAGDGDLVLEMGARGVGHLAYLCDLARPDVACVTGVGSAHVGEFGSPALVALGKGELVEALAPDGTAVLAADDPAAWAMRQRTAATVIGFGTRRGDVRWDRLRLDDRGRPTLRLRHGSETAQICLALIGAHQAHAATAAAACALATGLDLATVASGLEAARPPSEHRMQLKERADGLLVIDDAYNANLEAVLVALDALVHLAGRRAGRAVAVLGAMRELGTRSREAHCVVAERAASLGVELVWWRTTDDRARLADLGDGDTVLVKGSRADRLERVVSALCGPASMIQDAVTSDGAGCCRAR